MNEPVGEARCAECGGPERVHDDGHYHSFQRPVPEDVCAECGNDRDVHPLPWFKLLDGPSGITFEVGWQGAPWHSFVGERPVPESVPLPDGRSAEDEEWMNTPLGTLRPTWATELGTLYDDALVIARAIARKHGYALARHGTEMRDLDIVAVPWTEAASPADVLATAIRDHIHASAFGNGEPVSKPHGRLVWTINLKHSIALGHAAAADSRHFHPYIDLSVMPILVAGESVPAAEGEGK